jgi:hypothetical protein
MSLQDARDVAAKRNNSEVFPAGEVECEKHDPFGKAVPSKLRRHLRVGKHHSIAIPAIFRHRQLSADFHFEAAFGSIVNYRRGWDFLRHQKLDSQFSSNLPKRPDA